MEIIDRLRQLAFPPDIAQLKHVHILDLDRKGYIKPHIDAVRVSIIINYLINNFIRSIRILVLR